MQTDPAANSAWSWTVALQVLTCFFPSPQLPSATNGITEQQRSKGFIITYSVSTNVNHQPPGGTVTLQKSQSWEMGTQARRQASSVPNWPSLISITAYPTEEAETQRETDQPKSHSWARLGPEWGHSSLLPLVLNQPPGGPQHTSEQACTASHV